MISQRIRNLAHTPVGLGTSPVWAPYRNILIGIVIAALGSIVAGLALDDFHQSAPMAPIPADVSECTDERVYDMVRAFMMTKVGGAQRPEPVRVRFEDSRGDATEWDGAYLLDEGRLHVPLQKFADIGYDVRYDPVAHIVLMRRSEATACIAFSCRNAGSTKVLTYWSDDPNPRAFDAWWNHVSDGDAYPGRRYVKTYFATCPACLCDGERDSAFYIPVRVLAGAVGSVPKNQVVFNRGSDGKDWACNSVVTIRIPGRIDELPQGAAETREDKSVADHLLDMRWVAPPFLASQFK